MSLTHTNPPQHDELLQARRLYLEQYGAALVSNGYLRIAVLCLSAVCLGLLLLNLRTHQAIQNLKPLVIRIDDVGRAEALSYASFQYQPREAEIRYFLMDFVRSYYGRIPATMRNDFAHSLYFLDGRLANATMEEEKKNKSVEAFLAGQGDQIEISVQNVSIEDLRTPPYKATVEFEKLYYSPSEHKLDKRERYLAHFVFIVRDKVPNALIPINPLGLTITYFHEDQAFD
jgi:type IV secretory pathway TrbF-like protein